MPKSPTELFTNIRTQLYDRLLKGKLNDEVDIAVLGKHLALATEAEDWFTVGRTHNLLGVIASYRGRFALALEHYQAAFEAHTQDDAIAYMALIQSNLGEIYRRRGQFSEAQSYYLRGLEILGTEKNVHVLSILQNNLAWTRLFLGDVDGAFPDFEAVVVRTDGIREHVDVLLESICGLAEVFLYRQDLPQALAYGKRALEQAQMSGFIDNICQSNWTLAHYADFDPHYSYAEFAQTARDGVSQEPLVWQAMMVLNEARYQQHFGKAERVAELKAEGLQILRDLGLAEEADLAERTFTPE